MRTKKGRKVLKRLKINGHRFNKLIDTDMPKPVFNIWKSIADKYAIREGPNKGMLDFDN